METWEGRAASWPDTREERLIRKCFPWHAADKSYDLLERDSLPDFDFLDRIEDDIVCQVINGAQLVFFSPLEPSGVLGMASVQGQV